MSRTGIHGGIRRGTAAAAVGAVLVLSTGVQASLADDAVPPPQGPAPAATAAAPAATGAAFGLSIAARQTAPATPGPDGNGGAGQHRDEGRGSDEASPSAPATRTPRTPSTIPAVPGALLPVITASPSAGWTTPAPAPTSSGTPLAPGPLTPSAAAPTGSQAAAGTGSAPASGPRAVPASGAAPAAPASMRAGVPGLPAASAGGIGPAAAQPTGQGGIAPTTGAQPGLPGAGGEARVPVPGAVQAGGDVFAPDRATPSRLPTALSINARNSQPLRLPQAAGPQAAGPQAAPGRAVSSTGPLPDVPNAMIWLGAGLVGVGAAAGLVFLRMRRL